MKSTLRYLLLTCIAILVMRLIWLIGVKGFASWVLGFWIITLYMASESLIKFLLEEKRKKRFGK